MEEQDKLLSDTSTNILFELFHLYRQTSMRLQSTRDNLCVNEPLEDGQKAPHWYQALTDQAQVSYGLAHSISIEMARRSPTHQYEEKQIDHVRLTMGMDGDVFGAPEGISPDMH